MTFWTKWMKGAGIAIAVAVTLFPAAFYAVFLTGAASIVLSLIHSTLSEYAKVFIWTALSALLAPYFLADHADVIVKATRASN